MNPDSDSPYGLLAKRYINGRIPFRVWIFSAAIAASVMIVFNLVQQQAFLQGFFSLFFINLAVTIPVFAAQAHFVGLALQRKPQHAKKVLTTTLLIGWTVTGICIAWAMCAMYESWNAGTVLLTSNYVLMIVVWWLLSFVTLRQPGATHRGAGNSR